MGLAPTGKRRLVTAPTQSGHWLAAFVERELWNIGCERTGPALLSIDIRRVDHLGAPPAREELPLGGRGAVNWNPGKPVDVSFSPKYRILSMIKRIPNSSSRRMNYAEVSPRPRPWCFLPSTTRT